MGIWSGEWWSSKYPAMFAKGTVVVNLPEDLESINNNIINVKLTYTGIYKNGVVEELASTGSYIDNRIKMSAPYENGTLTYDIEIKEDSLDGTYVLTTPMDSGSVKLIQGENPGNPGQCIIF